MRTYLLDLAERTLATYAAAFVGLLLADGFDVLSLATLKAAAVAATPAALSVIKGAIAKLVGDRDSAALLPRSGRTTTS